MNMMKITYNIYTVTPVLANPDALTGLHGDVYTFNVVNIPETVPASHVLRVFDHTVIAHPDKLETPYTVDYAALGMGKIVEGGK